MNPYNFQLHAAYPNPFNPMTTISYDISVGEQFTIGIFDITGKLVKTLISGKQSVGQGIVRWDGQNDYQIILPSGVYFYRLSSADFTVTRKIVLLK
jgi:flagellar hook assembly protein FlgD